MVDDDTLDPTRFAAVAAVEPPSAVRRAGWMIEHLTPLRLDETAAAVRWSEPLNLDMYGKRRGTVDRRWGIRINTALDPDVEPLLLRRDMSTCQYSTETV
jgi:predicted transcriptional regulator of viral defense system